MNTNTIVLDLYSTHDYISDPFTITKGKTNIIPIKLKRMGLPYDITGLSVRVGVRKSDFTVLEIEAEDIKVIDAKSGLIQVNAINDLTGMTYMQVQVSDGDRKLSWKGTIYFVNRSPEGVIK